MRSRGYQLVAVLAVAIVGFPAAALAQSEPFEFPAQRAAAQDQYGSASPAGAEASRPGRERAEEAGGREQSRRNSRSGVSPARTGAGDRAGGLPLADAQGDRLPFTGLDIGLLALLGLLLVATGAVLKVVQRRGARGPRRVRARAAD